MLTSSKRLSIVAIVELSSFIVNEEVTFKCWVKSDVKVSRSSLFFRVLHVSVILFI